MTSPPERVDWRRDPLLRTLSGKVLFSVFLLMIVFSVATSALEDPGRVLGSRPDTHARLADYQAWQKEPAAVPLAEAARSGRGGHRLVTVPDAHWQCDEQFSKGRLTFTPLADQAGQWQLIAVTATAGFACPPAVPPAGVLRSMDNDLRDGMKSATLWPGDVPGEHDRDWLTKLPELRLDRDEHAGLAIVMGLLTESFIALTFVASLVAAVVVRRARRRQQNAESLSDA